MFWFDPMYFVFVAPAFILALWAQYRVRSAYARAQQQPAPLTGAAAARHILDQAGLSDVAIEMIPGNLSDHYDPREKVLRLSQDVYENRSLAAVGIAAHESGHALQDAKHYAPLAVRNLAVSAAGFGSGLGILMLMFGAILAIKPLFFIGLVAFGAVVFFQLVNLPVEFDASNRAKRELVQLGIVPQAEMPYVNDVLNAAAWTYAAATLEAILILLYYVLMFAGRSRRD